MGTDKLIALTPGEPAGIGPDILLTLLVRYPELPLLVFADKYLLEQRAQQLQLDINICDFNQHKNTSAKPALLVKHIPMAVTVRAGDPDPANAAYILQTLNLATQACLQGSCSALVTGPVNKNIINQAGFEFRGHTEYLAQLTKSRQPVMLLANERIKVALATTHLPLAKVPAAITSSCLSNCITILRQDLISKFGIANPRIAICGLNPHAGEGGYLGDEEIKIITPVITSLVKRGFKLLGPLPADTAFTAQQLAKVDVVLAMYHDQGLPVIKAQGFGETVNVTLGLPIIRTSVDHGTALALAGSGTASCGSLYAAVMLAHKCSLARDQSIVKGGEYAVADSSNGE